MDTMGNKLSTWLAEQLNERSWSARELARRTNMSQTSISRYLEGTRTPSPDACRKIARAFGIANPQSVMRLAGHLPPIPEPIAEEKEALAILRTLPTPTRATILQMLRGLRSATTYPTAPAPTLTLAEPNTQYPIPNTHPPNTQSPISTLQDQITPLTEQYPALGPLFDQAIETLPEHAVQALIYNVQIWISSSPKDIFTTLHRQLSDFLATMSS